MADTCNATDRERARLYICERPIHHEPPHREGQGDDAHEWTDATERGSGDTIIEQ